MTDAPILMRWNGETFEPHRRHYKRIDAEFVIGEVYEFVTYQERSSKSHAHFFALVGEAWKNLPESMEAFWPTAEHLRKRAMIDAGYYDETIIDAGSKAAALRVAAFLRKKDEFAVVVVRGGVVVERCAKSMARAAMDKKTFQECKDATLNVLAQLIGVTPPQLEKQEEPA